MEGTLRALPNEKKVRRRLADIYGKAGMFQDALSHLELLLDDPTAQVLHANYLFQSKNFDKAIAESYKLIGFDPKTDAFNDKGTATNDAGVYLNLAIMLRSAQDNAALAERMINQAVVAYPKSPAAYLARGRYFIGIGEVDRGRSDVEKAYSLGPEDADVLLTMEGLAAEDKEFA